MEYPMKTMDDEWRYPHDFGTPQMIGSESCSYFNSNIIRRILCIYIIHCDLCMNSWIVLILELCGSIIQKWWSRKALSIPLSGNLMWGGRGNLGFRHELPLIHWVNFRLQGQSRFHKMV